MVRAPIMRPARRGSQELFFALCKLQFFELFAALAFPVLAVARACALLLHALVAHVQHFLSLGLLFAFRVHVDVLFY